MWWTLAAALALLAAPAAATLADESCSQIVQPDECILKWGCQWCASEEEAAPAEGERCRARPPVGEGAGAGAAAWCPGPGATLDPPEANVTNIGARTPHELEEGRYKFSPNEIRVETRKGEFQINFQLKTPVGADAEEIEKEINIYQTSDIGVDEYFFNDYFKWSAKVKKISKRVQSVSVSVKVLKCPAAAALAAVAVGTAAAGVPLALTLHCGAAAAACPRPREPRSPRCGGRGARRCGACECDAGWRGLTCTEKICSERGDMKICEEGTRTLCNEHGTCDDCNECKCDAPGEPYFDSTCQDFCELSERCAACVQRGGRGEAAAEGEGAAGGGGGSPHDSDTGVVEASDPCDHECRYSKIHVDSSSHWDLSLKRKQCTVKVGDCTLHYTGIRRGDEDRRLHLGNCTRDVVPLAAGIGAGGPGGGGGGMIGVGVGGGGGGSGATAGTENKLVVAGAGSGNGEDDDNAGALAGWVVGALALVALAGAAAALLLWRARASPERDAFAGMQYDIMEAEANQGENPLYRPPVTNYSNPLYATKQ